MNGVTDSSLADEAEGSPVTDAPVPSYAEAFPPLDCGAPPTAPLPKTWAPTKIRTSTITQVFSIPHVEQRYRDFDLGEHSELMKRVRQLTARTGVEVELSKSKDQSLHVVVSGKRDLVLDTRRQLLAALQTQANLDLKIPRDHHRFILGKGGLKLKDLEKNTATRIQVPRSEENSDLIKITGTKENIDKARHFIQLTSDEQAKIGFERLNIPKPFHPFISIQAQELRDKYSVRINIPPPAVSSDDISIAGDREGVTQATEEVNRIYETKKRTTTTISIQVGKSQHKYIIGPKGHTLQEILKDTGVSVEMPPQDSDVETVTLRGERDHIGKALTVVYEKASSVLIQEVKAPAWLHRFIIGRKGSNIDKITGALPKVHVEFNAEKDIIIIEGPPGEVETARDQLEAFTKQLISTMTHDSVTIPQALHRHVIGKNGATIQRIKTETGTLISMPVDGSSSDIIRIEGNRDGVAKAKTELLDLVNRIDNERSEQVRIEHRFHSKIIGSGGEKIRQVRDSCNGVQIIFPEQGRRSDFVDVRGPKDDVNRAVKMLQSLYSELALDNYTITLPVLQKFHKNIIGRGGAVIRQIREDTACRVELPKGDDKSDIITIIGRKEHVEKAKKAILAIQEVQECFVEETLSVPAKYHRHFVQQRAQIREDTSCRIDIPRAESGSDVITISGKAEGVAQAKKAILSILEEKESSVEETMSVPVKYHRHFVQQRGQVLRNIGEEFGGVQISFPRSGTESERVVLKGAPECVAGAMQRITEIMTDIDAQVTLECEIPAEHHRSVMGTRGVHVQSITRDFEVQVKFPDRVSSEEGGEAVPRSNTVTVTGLQANAERACAALKALVPITEEVPVPFDYHRFIIGKKGAGVRQLMEQHNVHIAFPKQEDSVDHVVVKGPEDCVAQCRLALKEQVKRLDEEKEDRELKAFKMEVQVDPKYFSKLIGRRGDQIQAWRARYEVQYTFPGKDEPDSDLIVLQGYEENCARARDEIHRIVSELESYVSQTIEVDPRCHSRLIGQRGRAIRKVMDEFMVEVKFPSDKNSPDITITGTPCNVEDCKEHILLIVEEQMQEIEEREEERQLMSQYTTAPSRQSEHDGPSGQASFSVRDAPWSAELGNEQEFPTMGGSSRTKSAPAWGPRRH